MTTMTTSRRGIRTHRCRCDWGFVAYHCKEKMENIYKTIDDHKYVHDMDEHELSMHASELEDAYSFLTREYPKMATERRRLLDQIKSCLRRVESLSAQM